MHKLFITLLSIAISFASIAQTDGMSYQAVIIDSESQEVPGIDVSGNYLSSTDLSLRFSIFDRFGALSFQETHDTTTDPYGMVSLTIGQGELTALSPAAFTGISWDGTAKDLLVEVSRSGDDFVQLSRQRLLFVPYAFHRNITATGTLDVDGATQLNNSFTVEGVTLLNDALTVANGSPTHLSGNLSVDGITLLNNAFTVENGSPTHLTGNLTVDGNADFQGTTTFNDIVVLNHSDLQGPVDIGGAANLTSSLNVQGATSLNSTLQVSGITNLQSALSVDNGSSTALSGGLTVGGEATFATDVYLMNDLHIQNETFMNGQVSIDAGLSSGSDSNSDAYALRVEGASQGIMIAVDGGRNASKNFLSFRDQYGIHGCIEGQTLSELNSSFRFIWDNVMAGLDEGFALSEALACGFNVPPDLAEVASNGLQAIAAYAAWVELADYATTNVGVNFSSGGADYAEWLERLELEVPLQAGEVVGIFAGKISRTTKGAHEIKVISTNPIVLGNKPTIGKESNYERVAFLGQAPVRVVGPVQEGDYILPSGLNDGLAVAFNPSALSTARFHEIIGIAWESGESLGMNLVNVAIGLNTNDMASRVSALEQEMDDIRTEMAELKQLISGEKQNTKQASSEQRSEVTIASLGQELKKDKPLMTDAEFEAWIQLYGSVFEEVMERKRIHLDSIGSDYSKYPEAQALLESPSEAMRDMRAGKYMQSLWQSLEQRVR